MADSREIMLAEKIVTYSCEVKPGEKVWIDYQGDSTREMACELVRQVYKAGGIPFVNHIDMKVQHELLLGCTQEQMTILGQTERSLMEQMDCYIAIRGVDNSAEYSDIPGEKMEINQKYHYAPVHRDIRVPKTRWLVTRYPSDSMAQSAHMPLNKLKDIYFKATTIDVAKLSAAQEKLCDLMSKTDRVHIVGPGTDLEFSIKGQQCSYDTGKRNLPCGETGTAPILSTLNGVITYTLPAVEDGFVFQDIRFEIEKGTIIKATCNDNKRINRILDTDEGARRIGEFSIGTNPYIEEPFLDTLFDEKMAGTFHLTPGCAYDFADNGNRSAIHWDLVCSQKPEHGGGEIWFDDVLIRKDGEFVLPELQALNHDAWF